MISELKVNHDATVKAIKNEKDKINNNRTVEYNKLGNNENIKPMSCYISIT